MGNITAAVADYQGDFANDEPLALSSMSFRLSWVAYVSLIWKFVLRVLMLAIVCLLPAYYLSTAANQVSWPVMIGPVLAVAWTVYDFLALRAMILFTDDSGVWLSQGVFPWQKGVSGVKWRDVSEATYTVGFFSWALRSYSVRIGHRFTNDSEINLQNLRNGDKAAAHINEILIRHG